MQVAVVVPAVQPAAVQRPVAVPAVLTQGLELVELLILQLEMKV